jgi:zinc transport system ATP-binding protein
MRDGRVAYDGPPIAAFTEADLSHAHVHHHVDLDPPVADHSPSVTSPFDRHREERA